MYAYRISKFDPDASVEHRRNDWTSIADIGRRFFGEVLTRETYEELESRYLRAIRLSLVEGSVRLVRVTDLVRSSLATPKSDWITDGMQVDVDGALRVCRAQLREEVSCHLAAETGLAIDVGFDFYVYITSPTSLGRCLAAISELGLFVEEGVPSPYFTP